ncbi:MAG: hypothetical protein ACRET5_12100, partial [Steroidobacteraceae bacterium]
RKRHAGDSNRGGIVARAKRAIALTRQSALARIEQAPAPASSAMQRGAAGALLLATEQGPAKHRRDTCIRANAVISSSSADAVAAFRRSSAVHDRGGCRIAAKRQRDEVQPGFRDPVEARGLAGGGDRAAVQFARLDLGCRRAGAGISASRHDHKRFCARSDRFRSSASGPPIGPDLVSG